MRADFLDMADWRRKKLTPRIAKRRSTRRTEGKEEILHIIAKKRPGSEMAIRWRDVLSNFLSGIITNDADRKL